MKITFFSKIFIFEYFSKISFRNELTPFLPYFDTQHLIYEIFILFVGGSQYTKKN